jgi:hypothetical protein
VLQLPLVPSILVQIGSNLMSPAYAVSDLSFLFDSASVSALII